MMDVVLSPADQALEQMFGYYMPEAELAVPTPNLYEDDTADYDYVEYSEAA